MKFLLDKSTEIVRHKAQSHLVFGQLITPLTAYSNWGGVFAIDNGAYTRFDHREFGRILQREAQAQKHCLFVTVPDVVGDARRTLEIWQRRDFFVNRQDGWTPALVAQDGIEYLDIPWETIPVLFLGGRDPWKDSVAAQNLVRAAKILGVHVHIGRVNTPERFARFHDLGADTCDGSGVSRYDHMLSAIETYLAREPQPVLFTDEP